MALLGIPRGSFYGNIKWLLSLSGLKGLSYSGKIGRFPITGFDAFSEALIMPEEDIFQAVLDEKILAGFSAERYFLESAEVLVLSKFAISEDGMGKKSDLFGPVALISRIDIEPSRELKTFVETLWSTFRKMEQ